MIRNYIKIAWRNITKNKVFSLINIIGLTIGLSASFVIGLIIYYDTAYDTFHPDKDRIYRVVSDFYSPTDEFGNSGVTVALKDAIKDNPNYETIANFFVNRPMKVGNPELNSEFVLPNFVIYTDQAYFDVFEYKFLAGYADEVLLEPNTVVLSDERARQYFPDYELDEVIGKTLVYNDSISTTVTGVVQSLPKQTDLVFQEFISWPTLMQTSRRDMIAEPNWNNTSSDSQLFLKVIPNANFEQIQGQLDDLAATHRDADAIKYGNRRQFSLQPLGDIHFNSKYGVFAWERGHADKSMLRNLALVAVFLLVLGCINFINLNTAQATQRAKEVGIRKTLGSSRKQLVSQFMGETFLLVLLSSLLSIVMSKWLLKVFADFVPQGLDSDLLFSPWAILGIISLLLLVTFLSGFYPALVLSKFNTVAVLSNKLTLGDRKAKLRKTLTVFQFAIAQVFIIATLLVGKQIKFLLTKDMGFETEAIASVYRPITALQFSKLELFANRLKTISEIDQITIANNPPASYSSSITDMTRMVDSIEVHNDIYLLQGDTNYSEVFNINILAGSTHKNDTIRELVLNETAIGVFGFEHPESAVGQMLNYDGDLLPIVGVMQDFHHSSMHEEIKPMALIGDWYRPHYHQFQSVSMSIYPDEQGGLTGAIEKVRREYNAIYPDTDMRLEFMDETVASFYNSEKKIATLLKWATGLSILISCLGLLGLVIFTTNRRVKEIGVRKVLGASVIQINALICKEFIILVGVAFLIAAPIAYYSTHEWLKDFQYKTAMSWWVFLLSGVSMIAFSLLVMSIRTLKAAHSNPVNSLRSE